MTITVISASIENAGGMTRPSFARDVSLRSCIQGTRGL